MKPSREDVIQVIAPLMKIVENTNRVRRQGDASVLSALVAISRASNARPLDIANELDLHQSTVTRLIKALENQGLVLVSADPDDGRSCRVSLTKDGRLTMQRLGDVGIGRYQLMLEDWTAEEVQTFAALLEKLESSARKLREAKPPSTKPSWKQK
jgi:DNA-binding MarR family transcriptional regulator